MCSARDTQIIPIEFVRTLFVADPILLRIPEGASFQSNHSKSSPGQTLHQYSACAADADDAVVDAFHFPESVA